MTDIMKIGVEFAKKIQQTDVYLALKKEKENNDFDTKLNEMIEKYDELVGEVNKIIKNKNSKEEIDEKNEKISEIYKDIMNDENMIAYNKASDDKNFLMNKINWILIDAVNGKNPSECCNNKEYGCGSGKKCSKEN